MRSSLWTQLRWSRLDIPFSLDRSKDLKSFLVPASDYEILEVRETRMVLKNVGVDSSIKIGGRKSKLLRRRESSAST